MIAAVIGVIGVAYLACGLLFAIPFMWVGVRNIDPRARNGSWGFRLIILPGTIFLWPLLAQRWWNGIHQPPEECNAHRLAARKGSTQ